MPIGFLTQAERDRLNRFPDHIPHDDLIAFFTLSVSDQDQARRQRGEYNCLGFALQLCALRYLGFVPDMLANAPTLAIEFVADQLGLGAQAITLYGQRIATRTEHLRQVQAYLGFRKALPGDFEDLAQWLLARAMEHDKPALLLQLVCEQLRRDKVVRPGLSRLERLVATARRRAQEETYRRLAPLLTPSRRAWLDALLETEADTGRTRLAGLRASSSAATAQQIRTTLEKIEFLQLNGVADWDLSVLNPNRIKLLAQIGRRATNQYLQRSPLRRRYPILVAFLKQALLTLTDEAVEMFDQCLWDCHTDAKKDLEAFRQQAANATNEKLLLFRDLGQILLDPTVADDAVRAVSFQRVPAETLRAALAETKQLIRPRNDAYVDYFSHRYSYLRQFIPLFLQRLTFRSCHDPDPLLKAMMLLQDLDARKNRSLMPADAPLAFVPLAWRPYVVNRHGLISRRYYELCTLWVLRQALRAGDIWVEHSRRYASPETYLTRLGRLLAEF